MTPTLIILVTVAAGLGGLARFAPGYAIGIALLAGATSSLPWQLGAPNVALPLWTSLGLAVGLSWRRTRRRGSPIAGRSSVLALLVVMSTALTVGLVRSLVVTPELGSALNALTEFNPRDEARFIHGAATWLIFPWLLLLLAEQLTLTSVRCCVARFAALTTGLVLAAPLIQLSLGIPLLIRPDQRMRWGSGLVGFSQDPHAHAGLLLIMIMILCGAACQRDEQGASRTTTLCGLAAGLACVELLYTNSLSGLVALVCAGALFLALALARRRRVQAAGRSTTRSRLLAGGVLMILLGVIVPMTLGPALPGTEAESLPALKYFDPELVYRYAADSLGDRATLATNALTLIEKAPLWGVGPGRFGDVSILRQGGLREDLRPENAHNIYLQLGAELGLPSAALFLLVVGDCLARITAACLARQTRDVWLLCGLAAALFGSSVFSLANHILLLPGMHFVFTLLVASGVAFVPRGADWAPR